jgi:hypothetical protein
MPVHTQIPPPATNRRAAWVLVIIMSALFVLAILATIWGFVRQAHIFMAAKEQSKIGVAAAGPPEISSGATITLAPGARILSATTESGKLVLHVATPAGSEVEIIDLATGKLTGQVKASRSAGKLPAQ